MSRPKPAKAFEFRQDQVGAHLMAKRTVAAYLDCTISYVERLIAQGQLPTYRLGKKFIRISRDDVDDLIDSSRLERIPNNECAIARESIDPRHEQMSELGQATAHHSQMEARWTRHSTK